MFTQRNIFSSSLAISAARVELTGTTRAIDLRVERLRGAAARRIQSANNLGNLCQCRNCLFPGSSRSGETPGRNRKGHFSFSGRRRGAMQNPLFSRMGLNQFFGVPVSRRLRPTDSQGCWRTESAERPRRASALRASRGTRSFRSARRAPRKWPSCSRIYSAA